MYNVHKMLTLDSNPLIRLEKRLNALKHTHNAGLARSAFLTENNFNVNRQLMESLILRLRSVDPKSKKSKRVANRVKVGSPKRMRPMTMRSQELFNPHYTSYTGFQSKLHTVKRMHPSEYCDSSDSTFLKDLKELPPLHPSEVETVLRKKDMSTRNSSQKGEPIFPPPPDPSCTIPARAVATSSGKPSPSSVQRIRKGLQSFNQVVPSPDKYAIPTTSCVPNFGQSMRSSGLASSLPVASCPYVDLHAKYDPDCYIGAPPSYDQFGLPGFSNDYTGFNPYNRSPGYAPWVPLGKYDHNMSNRVAQTSASISPDSAPSYRSYPNTAGPENPSGFATNLPFNQSFQNEDFMQGMPYPTSIDPQQSSYGINLSSYNYPPPNTTSYM
ncbi:unnamed protein product [Taenia asiatica]|uniref:Expressed conserved protein n=1 Tax=Taenia asiatica TaxID=60517 RepID=A0A0R3W567_TAEAS|nr:unnamed protein product [Taenia asiatica]